ncbi:MAG: ABC transporter permease [Methyloceanibacter sp.]|uniref:ABC transporter permease n=1 Tax=Methyloceanibacter sp. TaxID=1965321 RepID=UPI001D6B6FE1|nr:ABC transporter permease [Methyloceanibacter sp.]MCB1442269.1 ABC transporter permease [Methyloceanibacter sp.]MCC0059076.1 ABC transporter permease [Hyphomicrobiaceae bacterium]
MDAPTDVSVTEVAVSEGIPQPRAWVSALNKRRWQTFKANRRGYWSLWIFLFLFIISLFAEFIANDKPILIEYEGRYYWPIFQAYPETDFGGIFETEADYRDPVVQDLITEKGGWMIWPPIRFSYNTQNKNPPMAFPVKPTWLLTDKDCALAVEKGFHPCNADLEWNWLGTDDQGRDVVARIIYGFRISVLFGLVLTIFSSVIGVAAGAVQGYFGGWTDLLFQRFIEIWTSVPQLYLLIIVAAVIEPNFWILLGILLAFSWVALVGVVRAEFLRARNFEYVTAARALGLPSLKIIFRHLLPNAMVATLTFMPFILNGSITTLTSLDFLGFGLPPGSPSLGELLAQGKDNLQAPWLGLTAFFVIAIMLSLLIFVGEAVRDALDPRKTLN